MCDYSLMAIPNRLAVEGDSLETYRFSTGSIGLASPESIRHSQSATPAIPDGFWEKFWAFFTSTAPNASRSSLYPAGGETKSDCHSGASPTAIPPRAHRGSYVHAGHGRVELLSRCPSAIRWS